MPLPILVLVGERENACARAIWDCEAIWGGFVIRGGKHKALLRPSYERVLWKSQTLGRVYDQYSDHAFKVCGANA